MTSEEARRRILNFLGGQYVERWPESEARAFFYKQELSYEDHLALGAFLYGNLRDAELVYAALAEQLGAAAKDHDHMRRWLADLASGTLTTSASTISRSCTSPTSISSPARATSRTHRRSRSCAACMHGRRSGRACGGRRGGGPRLRSSARHSACDPLECDPLLCRARCMYAIWGYGL